jgi:hypothetical protein
LQIQKRFLPLQSQNEGEKIGNGFGKRVKAESESRQKKRLKVEGRNGQNIHRTARRGEKFLKEIENKLCSVTAAILRED